jgi:hypothetical protein
LGEANEKPPSPGAQRDKSKNMGRVEGRIIGTKVEGMRMRRG